MALTVTPIRRTVFGNRRVVTADVAFDNAYTAGGLALTPANLGLSKIDHVVGSVASKSDLSLAVSVQYDYTNSKLVAFKSNTSADLQQVAAAADLSTYTARITAIGN